MTSKLSNFLDTQGRLKQWPSKRGVQVEAVSYLATKFPRDRSFTEGEINEIIKQYHTFGDWAIIRRELVELGFFSRDAEGKVYTRTEKD